MFVFSVIMGPKKETKLSRFVPLDDTARLPGLLSSLTLLGGDSIQELDEVSNDNQERRKENTSASIALEGALSCSTCQVEKHL